MAYLKRQKVPKSWPIRRKGTAYVVSPNFNIEGGMPIFVVLRDLLKVAETKRDVKGILHADQILLNNKKVRDGKNNMQLFDVLGIVPSNKFYRMELSEKGKFAVNEIDANSAGKKISKVIDKKMLKGKKTQLNLIDGRNFLTDLKCKVNDSVLINLLEGKIEKCIALGEKANVIVFKGKHAGEKGVVSGIKGNVAEVKIDGKNVEILIKQLMVVE